MSSTTQRVDLGVYWVEVVLEKGKPPVLRSSLERVAAPADSQGDERWDEHTAAMDGMEALLLAMAGDGLSITTPEMICAIQSAIHGIDNHYGE